MSKRIIIYRFGQLGDTIVIIPALRALRRYYANDELYYLNREVTGSGFVVPKDVIPSGLIDQFWTYRLSSKILQSGWELFKLLCKIRLKHIDTLVYLVPRSRSYRKIKRDKLFFRLAGIKNYIADEGFEYFNMEERPLPNVEHELDHYLRRLENDGIKVPTKTERKCELELKLEHQEWAEEFINNNIPVGKRKKLVAVSPFSKSTSKVWPSKYFDELIAKLTDDYGLYPLIIGGSGDKDAAEKFIKCWGIGLNCAGASTILQSAALIQRCRLFIGNDSGTMHIAAAVNTPCVIAFSAQDMPGRWYPYGIGHYVYRQHPSCEGCRLNECTENALCMRSISVKTMLDACGKILSE
jgi:lipopolysaccharide heptosyltransferase III